MQKEPPILLHHCLYFTANSLARAITRMTEEEFRITGLSPSHAFLLMLVNVTPGISQKELARQLHLTPSTVTRFIDHLAHRGYLERRAEGKNSEIYPTEKGSQLQETIGLAWRRVYQRYSELLGDETGRQLTAMTDQASQILSQ
jgi:DNA-binding MarR family transcriptional regulator